MIREIEETDIPELLVIGRRMYSESQYASFNKYSEEYITALLGEIITRDDYCGFVAIDDGKIVGYIAGCAINHYLMSHRQAVEFALYVAPEYRNSKHGLNLVLAYVKWAKEFGVDEIVIDNNCLGDSFNRERIGKLYEAVGFKCIGSTYHIVEK